MIATVMVSGEDVTESHLPKENVKEIVDYFVESLNIHPKLANDMELKHKIVEFIRSKTGEPLTEEEFIVVIEECLALLGDSHSLLDIFHDEFLSVDLELKWLESGLFIIKENSEFLSVGDQVIRIGEKDITEIAEMMNQIIPSENEYWLRARSEQLLVTKKYLEYMKLINMADEVYFTVKNQDGELNEVKLGISKEISIMQKYFFDLMETPYYYSINQPSSMGILNINVCKYDDAFKKTLKNYFEEVTQENIEKVVIDLRTCIGGDSRVVKEIISYFDVDNYTSLKNKKVNMRMKSNDITYNGDVFVLTSNHTFSSASAMAGIFKYNQIAELVGEPIGNSTLNYGNAKMFKLPYIEKQYYLSTKEFIIPSEKANDTIVPDKLICTTIDDILNKRDPIMSWIVK